MGSFYRTDEYETIIDNSTIAESFAKRLMAYPNNNGSYNTKAVGYFNKNSVQEVVNELTQRTGLSEYVNIVNSKLKENDRIKSAQQQQVAQEQQQYNSLIDIPYIKEEIDKAIQSKSYPNYILLLNDLKLKVKTDHEIPEQLKNVMGDDKLLDYLKQHMPIYSEKTDYSLSNDQDTMDSEQTSNNNDAAWFNGGK